MDDPFIIVQSRIMEDGEVWVNKKELAQAAEAHRDLPGMLNFQQIFDEGFASQADRRELASWIWYQCMDLFLEWINGLGGDGR